MIPYSRPKLSDFYTLSQSKLLESHTLHSGTHLYSPYKAVLPPLPPEEPLDSRTKTAMRARFDFSRTMETLVSGHPRDANRVSVALAGRLRECKSREFVWKFRKTASRAVRVSVIRASTVFSKSTFREASLWFFHQKS